MSWTYRLGRRLEPYAITNISLFIVIGQVFVLLTSMLGLIDPNFLLLIPSQVLAGEWWRLFSFVFIPPAQGWLFIAFALYLFYLYGTALEHQWGALRYNLFLLTGWALTVGLSFFSPHSAATNLFIGGSVFLAFARLHPNFELLLFFILPVKIKWLALIAWIGYGYAFAVGGRADKLAIIAVVGNFLLFFAGDMLRSVRQTGRRQVRRVAEATETREPRHTCVVCGRTDLTDPMLDFRYAADDQCYCADHLPSRRPAAPPPPAGQS